ncbi:MAG: hypothetical protein MK226_22425 [Saprospiraceae bacterium]|nr:hypothetical protein [Saprospiraceae bacterium]
MQSWNRLFSFLCLAFFTFSLSSCLEDKCDATLTYTIWEPVYLQEDDIRKDIEIEAARELQNPGNIYYYQDYILINEIEEGVHIIDNTNPSNPRNIAFINVPGARDMAVRNDILYVDNYIDLLSIDISKPDQAVLMERCEDVFVDYYYFTNNGFIVDYKATELTENVECTTDTDVWDSWFFRDDVLFVNNSFDMSGAVAESSGNAANVVGVGGSMARFTIAHNHLYVVDDWQLKVFGLQNATKPELANTVEIGWGVETIFPYRNNLFMGAVDGMYIFDNSDPTAPYQLSKFEHAQACDPVFIKDEIAYVTLRDGVSCQNFTNQLDVVDVSDLMNPTLLATHQMHRPHGLSVVDNSLYICEDDQGVKVFDRSEHEQLGDKLLTHQTGFQAYDIIALGSKNLAMVIGEDGLYQFDISDRSKMNQLSVIPVIRE